MYEGLRRYLEGGGNIVCLSGNSLFWRVSYNEEGTILECRKVDAPGEQLPHERRGECWHSHDGLRGGLMRECGYPGWKLIGLETLGWNNQSNPEQFGPYLVKQPGHFLFNHPEKVDVKAGDPVGQSPDGGLPRANGHEIDVRPSTLAALQEKPVPEGATMPNDPPGMTRLANGIITWKKGGAAFDYFFRGVKPGTDQGGEMIYWERPDGGRVFNTGSIGTGWALLADPKLQILLRNVLHHFGVPQLNVTRRL
jgi:N,N-dimethylformamidase